MFEIHKNYLFDEKQKIIAVQIPIEEFKLIEESLENYGLSKMIDETLSEQKLDYKDAIKYYNDLKNGLED
jgi:hypothetical protein